MRKGTKAFLSSIVLAAGSGCLLVVVLYQLACYYYPPVDGSGHGLMPVGQVMFSLVTSMILSFVIMVVSYYKIRRRLGK